jgi:glycosyltransferase involved in cell wall biosynthesis
MNDSRVLRVAAFLPYPLRRVPGQRYRIEQWAPLLRDEGIEVMFLPFLSQRGMDVLYEAGHQLVKLRETLRGYALRLRELRGLSKFDVAFVFREAAMLGPAWLERRIASRLPVVFDFDDAIYLRPTSGVNWVAGVLKDCGKARDICKAARHVTVGSEHLATFASVHCAAVTVIPPTVDTQVYVPQDRPASPRPVVGWTGSVTTAPYLCAIAPALRALRERIDYELRVIGAVVEVPGVQTRQVPWSADTEVEDLRPVDVGLMPLPDDEWARGKCGMKAIQYMGLGIPPVVSPVGVNATLVEDGVHGFHARSEGDWVDRVERLLRAPLLRRRMGAEARRKVEGAYSARVQAARMAHVLRHAAGIGNGGKL